MDAIIGQRWMLKFYVGLYGGSDPKEIIPQAVLKTLVYDESFRSDSQGDPSINALTISSPVEARRKIDFKSSDRPHPTSLGATESIEPEELRVKYMENNESIADSSGKALKERDYGVDFDRKGYTARVNLRTREHDPKPQSDLRFRAALQAATTEEEGAETIADLIKWFEGNRANSATSNDNPDNIRKWLVENGIMVPATADGENPADQGALEYVIQPMFYIEQLFGFFSVAELIEKSNPVRRRLLISIHIHKSNANVHPEGPGEQRYVVTSHYNVTTPDEPYTVGFHQDMDGAQSRLEFYFGRDDNYAQFATHNLDNNDKFFFKRADVSEDTTVGIGCWPSESDEQPTLNFTGFIKEIICDPWGECTPC